MLGQTLKVTQDTGNLQYHFAIFLGAKVLGKLTDFDVVRHMPEEISCFCHYLLNYQDKLKASVRCIYKI